MKGIYPPRAIIITILMAFVTPIYAQNVTISGFVFDQETGEPLIGATVFVPELSQGTTTNNFGFFAWEHKVGDAIAIQVSFTGYSPQLIYFTPKNDTLIKVRLSPGTLLNEFVIKRRSSTPAPLNKADLSISIVKQLPTITGEADPLKSYQLMPGIQGGTEMNNGLFVRGGTPDQNLFLLDDVPLFNVSHLAGLYSVFDPSMVKNIDFYKAGFPARYGGRTSAVIDVRNKDGNTTLYNGEIGFSLILSKFFIEGPITKNKSSFAFSVRRSNIDWYSFLFGQMTKRGFNVGYTFYDMNAKANFQIDESNRLIVNVYKGQDKYFYTDKSKDDVDDSYVYDSKFKQRWGNTAISTRWQHVYNTKVFQNTTVAFTNYRYTDQIHSNFSSTIDDHTLSNTYQILSSVSNLILKSDIELIVAQFPFKIGGEYSHQAYTPTRIQAEYTSETTIDDDEDMNYNSQVLAHEFTLYSEYEFQFHNLEVNAGIRTNVYHVEQKAYPSLQPRINLNYPLNKQLALNGSVSRMQQVTHLLTNSNAGLPTDLWVPSTKTIAPETSNQVSLGATYTISKYSFALDAYAKKLSHLLSYKEGVVLFSVGQNWDEKLEMNGEGTIHGVEFMARKNTGRLTGWLAYTLSKNERRFANINHSNPYPFKYDQRHDIALIAMYDLSKRLSLSGTWTYHTGHAITLPQGKYQLYNYEYLYSNFSRETMVDVHIYESKNAYRMPDYHRLDLGFNFTKQKPKGIAKWSWGVYNAYNRQNAYYVFFKEQEGVTKLYQQSVFPLFINFGYSYLY